MASPVTIAIKANKFQAGKKGKFVYFLKSRNNEGKSPKREGD